MLPWNTQLNVEGGWLEAWGVDEIGKYTNQDVALSTVREDFEVRTSGTSKAPRKKQNRDWDVRIATDEQGNLGNATGTISSFYPKVMATEATQTMRRKKTLLSNLPVDDPRVGPGNQVATCYATNYLARLQHKSIASIDFLFCVGIH